MDAYDAVDRDYHAHEEFQATACDKFAEAIRLLQNAIQLTAGECVGVEITGSSVSVIGRVGKYDINPENFRRILK